jgi:hypothetical protein
MDDAEREALAIEHRALFDVELDVGACGVVDDSCGQFSGVETKVANRIGDTDSVTICAREGCRV